MFRDLLPEIMESNPTTESPSGAGRNGMGGRFPLQYTSPINGVSIAWAITSGYQVGEYVATL